MRRNEAAFSHAGISLILKLANASAICVLKCLEGY